MRIPRWYSSGAVFGRTFESEGGAPPERYKRGRLFVGASEIASLINANPYVSMAEAVDQLWEKNNKRTFNEALARNKLQAFTAKERLNDMGVLGLATEIVDTEDPKEYRLQLKKVLRRASTVQDKNVVCDFINTSRGVKCEKPTFENLKMKNPLAKLTVDDKLYRRAVQIPDSDIEYLISGYIDGVEINSGRIIEIKTRQNRFFNHVPLYEQIQCQTYLFLTGLTVCEHTESFRGAEQSTTLHFHSMFWNHVLQRLNTVILAFYRLLRNTSMQDSFLQSRDLFQSTKDNKYYKTDHQITTAIKQHRQMKGETGTFKPGTKKPDM